MSEAVSIADEHRMIMSCMKFIDVSVLSVVTDHYPLDAMLSDLQ